MIIKYKIDFIQKSEKPTHKIASSQNCIDHILFASNFRCNFVYHFIGIAAKSHKSQETRYKIAAREAIKAFINS